MADMRESMTRSKSGIKTSHTLWAVPKVNGIRILQYNSYLSFIYFACMLIDPVSDLSRLGLQILWPFCVLNCVLRYAAVF